MKNGDGSERDTFKNLSRGFGELFLNCFLLPKRRFDSTKDFVTGETSEAESPALDLLDQVRNVAAKEAAYVSVECEILAEAE